MERINIILLRKNIVDEKYKKNKVIVGKVVFNCKHLESNQNANYHKHG